MVLALDQVKISEDKEPEPDDVFTRKIPLRGDSISGNTSVWKAFEISDANKQLNGFIKVIDPDPLMTATVKLHSTGPNPNPSALWCMTTSEAYETIVKLAFVLTLKDIVGDSSVLSWVNDKLGLNIESLETPDIIISVSKKVLYSLEDLTPSDPKWT